jgi:hypothetical protein
MLHARSRRLRAYPALLLVRRRCALLPPAHSVLSRSRLRQPPDTEALWAGRQLCNERACIYEHFWGDTDVASGRRLLEHPSDSDGYHFQLGTDPAHVFITGHGLINLDRTMMFEGGNTWLHVSDDVELSTGEDWTFTVQVSQPAEGAPPSLPEIPKQTCTVQPLLTLSPRHDCARQGPLFARRWCGRTRRRRRPPESIPPW